jgi:hypothetical protein
MSLQALPSPTQAIVYSVTPPAQPIDGQLWAYPVATNTCWLWLFRFNAGSSSAYKWEFIGGPPLHVDQIASFTITSTSPQNPGGPSITIARSGTYVFRWGAFLNASTANTVYALLMQNGSYTGAMAQVVTSGNGAASAAANYVLTPAAGDVWAVWHQLATATGTVTASQRFLEIVPIRVS